MTTIDTPITRLFGTRLPIVQAGMSWVSSTSALPLAVTNAGGLGVLAAGPMRLPALVEALAELREGATGAWAVNLPLARKGVAEALDLLTEQPAPVLIASQGGPKAYFDRMRAVGTRCVHVVASFEHARKAADHGVDALIVVGGEAGGHPPVSQVSTSVLLRQIAREMPEMPLIASGGFADGYGLASALALGAGAAQFGTRFIASEEANVHPAYQRLVLEADVQDTRTVGRGLGMIRAIRNDFTDRMEHLELTGADLDARRETFEASSLRAAAALGEVGDGKVEAGQSAGARRPGAARRRDRARDRARVHPRGRRPAAGRGLSRRHGLSAAGAA